MNETRPFKWVLGNFATGELIPAVPMDEIGGGEIDISVDNNDGADIEISLANAPQEVKNSWTSFYKEVLHFAACQNAETGDIIWAGMVNKISPNLKSRSLSFQLVNPKEYMAARIVGENFGATIEDPNAGITFTGASYADIIGQIVTRCFSPILGSSTAQPPNILGNVTPVPALGDVSFKVLFSDAMSYQEAMESAIEESGEDIETRFTARMDGSSRVVWDFRVGTMSAPHLNDSSSLELDIALIDDDDLFRISEFQADIDSTELFNSFYISSKAGDSETSKGMDLKNATLPSSDFPILLEKYYNPGVELSETQLNAQMSSWISKGMDTKRTGSISLELEDDRFKTWASSYLGRMVHFVGYDDTLSAGNTNKLRIVGVRLDTATGRAILDLMSKANRYPRLPRKNATGSKKNDKNSQSPSNRFIKQKDIKNIKPGGGPTIPPWEGGGSYPPSDAGPGGGFGTGSETVKDDNSPYEITNWGIEWDAELGAQIFTALRPTQNLSNVTFTSQIISDIMTWTVDQSIRTVETSSSLTDKVELQVGNGYWSEGSLVNYEKNRFVFDLTSQVNLFLADPSSWGINFPSQKMEGAGMVYEYAGVKNLTFDRGITLPIRDKLFICVNVSVSAGYSPIGQEPPYFDPSQDETVQFSIFLETTARSFESMDYPTFMNSSIIRNFWTVNVERVGDYGLIFGNKSGDTGVWGLYVNNFSNPSSINEWNWYSIPYGDAFSNGTNIGKMLIDKNDGQGLTTRSYLIGDIFGAGQPVMGLEMMPSGAPIAPANAYWEDLTQYFPLMDPSKHAWMTIESLGGFLVCKFVDFDGIAQVWFQDNTGTWRQVQTTGNDFSASTIIGQFKNWAYLSNGIAFRFHKVASWGL